jgi:hypothetical protein
VTNIHALSGIRTSDPNNQAATDLRLRPRGHWYRLLLRLIRWNYYQEWWTHMDSEGDGRYLFQGRSINVQLTFRNWVRLRKTSSSVLIEPASKTGAIDMRQLTLISVTAESQRSGTGAYFQKHVTSSLLPGRPKSAIDWRSRRCLERQKGPPSRAEDRLSSRGS